MAFNPKDIELFTDPAKLLISHYASRKRRNNELIKELYEFLNDIAYVGRNEVDSKKHKNLFKILFSPTYNVWGKNYINEKPHYVLKRIVNLVKKYGVDYPELVNILYKFKFKLELDFKWVSDENIIIDDIENFDSIVNDFIQSIQDYIKKISNNNNIFKWVCSAILKFFILPLFISLSIFLLTCFFLRPVLFECLIDMLLANITDFAIISISLILGILITYVIYKKCWYNNWLQMTEPPCFN